MFCMKADREKKRLFFRNKDNSENEQSMVMNSGPAGIAADTLIAIVILAIAFVSIIPLWHVVMASISDGQKLLGHSGMVWTPVGEATLAGYKQLFRNSSIIRGYANTVIYVVGGTLLGLVMNMFAGYILSRATKLRGFMILFCVITTMFNGGTVPTYMVIRALGMTGTPWSLIIPGCTNALFMLLMMNAFSQVDKAYVEAAEIDGAGHLTIMFKVMFPHCKGMALVTAINTAILKWNSWFDASIYVTNNREYWPLQLWVKQITAEGMDFLKAAHPDYDKNLLQYAVIIAATIPILIAFPFFIRKLEKGMVIGGVKG